MGPSLTMEIRDEPKILRPHLWVFESGATPLLNTPRLKRDFETRTLTQAREVTTAIRTNQLKPDLLLLNIGHHYPEEILAACNCQHIPVVILSDSDDSDFMASAYRNGAKEFFVRPLSENILLYKIQKRISERRLAAQLPGEGTLIPLRLNRYDQTLTRENPREVTALTQTEYKILTLFLAAPALKLERKKIIAQVWRDSLNNNRVLDFHLSNIREKLSVHSATIRYRECRYVLESLADGVKIGRGNALHGKPLDAHL